MDFLDPRHRKAHKQRLFIGYALVAIAIGLMTLLLSFVVRGYDIDKSNGQIIHNGTMYVSSEPNKATLYINGEEQGSKTNARLVLPENGYTLQLKKDGYREWKRTIWLGGSVIRRILYPRLILNDLPSTTVQNLSYKPFNTSQSPSKRWIITQSTSDIKTLQLFDTESLAEVPRSITNLDSLFSESTDGAVIGSSQWSEDEKHILLLVVYQSGKKDYLLLSLNDVSKNVNLSTALGVSSATMTLKNKKANRVYVHDLLSNQLYDVDISNKNRGDTTIDNVLQFSTDDNNGILYVQPDLQTTDNVKVMYFDGSRSMFIHEIAKDSLYFLSISSFSNNTYIAFGTVSDGVVSVYRNPKLANGDGKETVVYDVVTILRNEGATEIGTSPNSQFLSLFSGSKTVVFDVAYEEVFNLKYGNSATSSIQWIDGFRLMHKTNSGATIAILDFDGSNYYTLDTKMTDYSLLGVTKDLQSLIGTTPLSTEPIGTFNLLETDLETR